MVRLIISGCNGRMGHAVEDICSAQSDLEIAAGFDLLGGTERNFPVFSSPVEFTGAADVVVDFSSPSALEALLNLGTTRGIPLVLCTTGYSEQQHAEINAAAKQIPIFRSGNMSLGINVLMNLVRRAAAVLGENFDVEIVEKHHNKKVDAPSGTALMLADAAAEALPYSPEYVYERQSVRKPRDRKEIGISSIRGGNIIGEHSVIFAGRDEVIELSHSAMSREVFASGAVQAARFLSTVQAPGLYDMSDLLDQTIG